MKGFMSLSCSRSSRRTPYPSGFCKASACLWRAWVLTARMKARVGIKPGPVFLLPNSWVGQPSPLSPDFPGGPVQTQWVPAPWTWSGTIQYGGHDHPWLLGTGNVGTWQVWAEVCCECEMYMGPSTNAGQRTGNRSSITFIRITGTNGILNLSC